MDTAHALRGAPSETLVMMERDATRGPPPTAGQTTLEIAETIPRGASRNRSVARRSALAYERLHAGLADVSGTQIWCPSP